MAIRQQPGKSSGFSIEALKGPAFVLGLVVLMAGIGSLMVVGFDSMTTRILLAVGILLVGVFVAIDPEEIGRRLTAPGTLYSGNTLLIGAIVLAILAFANVLGSRRHERWDLTSNQQYTLSEQTANVLRELKQPVQAIAFYPEQGFGKQNVQDQLREYEVRSDGKFSVRFVDPETEPAAFQQYNLKEYPITLLVMGDRRQNVTGTREQDFTTGLIKLVNPAPKKLYFVTGHNERRVDSFSQTSYSQLKTGLESENFTVDNLTLAGVQSVPEDATVVVLAEPRVALTDDEKQMLQDYLGRAGKLLLITGPSLPNAPQVSLNDFVSKYGVEIGTQPVLDPALNFRGDAFVPVVSTYQSHKITDDLAGLATFYPLTTNVNAPSEPPRGVTVSKLIQTSDRSWLETSTEWAQQGQAPRFDEGTDPRGPHTIALAIETDAENPPPSQSPSGDQTDAAKPKTRLVVLGSANTFANQYISAVPSGNRDLFLNAANWLSGDEELISIRPKQQDQRQVFVSGWQANLVLYSTWIFLPAIVLAAGAAVWWARR